MKVRLSDSVSSLPPHGVDNLDNAIAFALAHAADARDVEKFASLFRGHKFIRVVFLGYDSGAVRPWRLTLDAFEEVDGVPYAVRTEPLQFASWLAVERAKFELEQIWAAKIRSIKANAPN